MCNSPSENFCVLRKFKLLVVRNQESIFRRAIGDKPGTETDRHTIVPLYAQQTVPYDGQIASRSLIQEAVETMRVHYHISEPGCVSTRTSAVESGETILSHIRWMFWLLLVAFVSPYSTAAQDVATPSAYELQPIFSDDCSKDTRADYKITGDVTWEAGRLTLQPNASIGRAIKAGAWAKVELMLDLPELTAAHPESELQLWFDLHEATACFVRLRRTLTEQGQTMSVALFDTGVEDGQAVNMLVREVTLMSVATGRLAIEYRFGKVQVGRDNLCILKAYIPNGNAAVAGFRVNGAGKRLSLTRMSATVLPALPELPAPLNVLTRTETTAVERQQMAKADAADARFMTLYGQRRFVEAASIGEEVLQIRKAALGDEHPDTAISLNNLGMLYMAMNEYAKAEPLIRLSLESRQRALGGEHADTASSLNNLGALYSEMGDFAKAEPLSTSA